MLEKQAQSFRYENLDDAQKEIRDSVRKTFDLLKDWERVITENKELKEKIKAMEREMEILKEKTANLERKNKIRGFDRDM
jgi:predicted RNase H-like nuclease (RuvC/YqgF family)